MIISCKFHTTNNLNKLFTDGKLEIRIGKIDKPIIANVDIYTSREWDIWRTFTAPVNKYIKGVHDVYFVFRGEKDLFDFNWWKFNKI